MSYDLKRLSPPIRAQLQAALHQAAQHPARRSEILGNTAIGLAAKSEQPQHAKEAPIMRAIAEQIARAAVGPYSGQATRDDFQETLEEHDEAHREFSEDIDVEARAADLHEQRTAHHGQRVSIAPLSWHKGTPLGRTGQFKYAPTQQDLALLINESGTLAYWQGEPHESSAITIDLALPNGRPPQTLLALPSPSAGGTDTNARPRGIISYGADGAITTVTVDAGFGTRFTVTGNYVSIQLAMDPPMAGAASGAMSFTGSMGAFASPSQAPVTYTTFLDQLANNAVTDGTLGPAPIPRPSHAAQILPILSDAIGGNVTLKFYGQGGLTLLNQFVYPIGQLLTPLPLSPEVQFVTLGNFTGQTANFRIPWQLSL